MNRHRPLLHLLLTAIVALCARLPLAQAQNGAQPFTTIKEVKVAQLSNGVQIAIAADGVLQYRSALTTGQQMQLLFPDARNGTGRNFYDINLYPVSYLQLSTPQNSPQGIGVLLQINNLISTSATFTQSPDGRSVLLTIRSDRTLDNTPGHAVSPNPPEPDANAGVETSVGYRDGQLAVRAVRADLHRLIAEIARQTGLSIAVDDAVSGEVSLNLPAAEPQATLRAIAAAQGLAIARENGVIMISQGTPTDLATYHLSETASFRMQNTQAQNASGLLPNFLYSYVKVNPEQNAVVATAPAPVLAKIGADLHAMDTPAPQILIEAIAVELTDTKDLDLGLTLGNPDPASFVSASGPGGTINFNTIGVLPRVFEANLHALEATGKARVRARPRLAVVNGRTADIFIGAQRFILTQFNQFGQTQEHIQPVDVGVKLNVTPLTGGNGEITVRLAPEVSNITELDLQTGLPVLSTRRAQTTVRVRDGETIAIGGLTLDQEQVTRGKIPILGDIPILGQLFRSKSRNQVRTELVIFVTPRILRTEDLTAKPSP
jgi:type IV pilus assembly protein PilQ